MFNFTLQLSPSQPLLPPAPEGKKRPDLVTNPYGGIPDDSILPFAPNGLRR